MKYNYELDQVNIKTMVPWLRLFRPLRWSQGHADRWFDFSHRFAISVLQ